jgi:hypothetical protein
MRRVRTPAATAPRFTKTTRARPRLHVARQTGHLAETAVQTSPFIKRPSPQRRAGEPLVNREDNGASPVATHLESPGPRLGALTTNAGAPGSSGRSPALRAEHRRNYQRRSERGGRRPGRRTPSTATVQIRHALGMPSDKAPKCHSTPSLSRITRIPADAPRSLPSAGGAAPRPCRRRTPVRGDPPGRSADVPVSQREVTGCAVVVTAPSRDGNRRETSPSYGRPREPRIRQTGGRS